ncbi:MAG: ATP synthase F0 subunit B [Cyanobacteria bacterium]|nr:ATP synthase F0 subunit B [Cyanobacteriota bacterium]
MLRQNLNNRDANASQPSEAPEPSEQSLSHAGAVRRLDIQQSLDVLEELILSSLRVPFTRRTLVDEDQILEQLDRIRLNLPTVFREAVQIVQQRNAILSEANQYAQELTLNAEQQAVQRLDELGIIRQGEAEANQLRQKAQQDCEQLRAQALSELEQWQQAAEDKWTQMRQQTEADCAGLKQEADVYAAQVLQGIEQQLTEMLRVVHNGRQSIQVQPQLSGADTVQKRRSTKGLPPSSGAKRAEPSSKKPASRSGPN